MPYRTTRGSLRFIWGDDDYRHPRPLRSALPAGILFLASPRKSSQKEGDPRVTRPASPAPLRYSQGRAAAQLGAAPLKQCSPTSPGLAPLLGAPRGGGKAHRTESKRLAVDDRLVFILPFASSSSAGRNGKKGEDCLRGEAPSSAAPVAAEQRRAPGVAGRRCGRDFSLLTFFWQDKRK